MQGRAGGGVGPGEMGDRGGCEAVGTVFEVFRAVRGVCGLTAGRFFGISVLLS
jgi:hypothetical protein